MGQVFRVPSCFEGLYDFMLFLLIVRGLQFFLR